MRFRAVCSIAVTIFACVAGHTAWADQRYVQRAGVDNMTCGAVSAPCKTLSAAVAAASAGDKIVCRDPGGGNVLIIDKGLEIDCSSARQRIGGNVSSNGGPNSTIIIDTSTSTDKVVRIRGLTVGGSLGSSSPPHFGIYIKSATAVFLEDVVVSDVNGIGIWDTRTGGQARLFVKNSNIRNNVGAGIVAVSGPAGITVLDHVTSQNNTYGIAVGTGNTVAIRNSVFSGNSVAGVEGDSGSQIVLNGSTITHNNIGIQSVGAVRLSNNDIAFNNTAISGDTGTFGNNRFSGNVSLGTTPGALGGATSDLGQR